MGTPALFTAISTGAVTSLAWAAVPLSDSSQDFSALSRTSTSTSTPALFTAISIGAVTSLAWAAVPLSDSSRDFSALSQTSTSTSTPALFTAIFTGVVTSLAATHSAALVVLLCTYGTGLYTLAIATY